MKSLRLACATALAGLFTLSPAFAADVEASASYVVTLGGINVAAVTVDLTDDGQKYTLDLSANVAGLGSMVASGTASATSTGRASSPVLAAQEFDLKTRANGEDFTVDVSYDGGNVSAFRVDPPLIDYDRVAIERSHLRGVTDAMAAFVIKGGTLDKSLCRRDVKVFTGVERFNIAMTFAAEDDATSPRTGYQGPVILCNIGYTPISGHFISSEMTQYLADSDRILIWYAPLGDTGYFIPYRMLLTTQMGDLSMVLTQMRY